MRRLPIFIAGVVLLSLAAVVVRATEDEFLRRGWYRLPTGSVYLSDGKGNVCGYSSWQHFVGAGGASGAWESLTSLPENLKDTGPCPVHEDRPDWLGAGLVHVLGPTPPMRSDGRGHVCYTSRFDGPNIYVKALPDGFKAEGMCPHERLPKAIFRTPNGQFYESDGDGHVCELLHAGSRMAMPVWAIPDDTTNDGPCPNRTEPPLVYGWHRVPDGTLYLADGMTQVCRYASWQAFIDAGGRDGTWTEIPKLPVGTYERPECEPPHQRQPGWYLMAERIEPVRIDEKLEMCSVTWKQFFAGGGELTQLVMGWQDPSVKWLKPCAIEVPKKLEGTTWLAAGWFRIGNGGIYLSDGRGHVCSYGSWEQFTNSPARGMKSSWTQTDVLPQGLIDDGRCQEVEIQMR